MYVCMYVCMKTNKTITIDDELNHKLRTQIENASDLINTLLLQYFSKQTKMDKLMKEEEIIQRVEATKEQLAKDKNVLKEFTKKEKEINKLNIPQEVLNDFTRFAVDMTEENLIKRYGDIYRQQYDFSIEDLLTAFKKFKEK